MMTRFFALIFLAATAAQHLPAQTTCNVSVTLGQAINPASGKLLGGSFDGRSSMDYDAGAPVDPAGYYDPATGAPLPAVAPLWDSVWLGGTRYPGNLEILNWNWSYTIGPVAGRTAQPCGPNGSNSQILQFGFDEFMAMTAARGIPVSDVQIMVNLYPSVGQANPAILAADWVEYCNAPNDGSNPRGGTDWAALRDSFGHPEPYGIEIWNIGNEPWQPGELGNSAAGASTYINLAIPIIDSMLAADPTVKITMAALGNGSSAWNSTLLASTALMSRIYGFSPHAFYDEDPSTSNPSVVQVQAAVVNFASVAAAQSKKLVLGDHGHYAPPADPDKAVRWEGTLVTADFLLMLSQVSNLEQANYWIFGNVKATWHPIRRNANGTYTSMALARLYKSFSSVFHHQSLTTALTNAANGNPVSAMRAAAFASNDGSKASVVVVNTSPTTDNEVALPVLAGFNLLSAKSLTASSLLADTFQAAAAAPLGNGNYAAPHASILIFEYTGIASTLSVGAIFGSPFCPGATVSVPFSANGAFAAGNVLTAELSSKTGSFASPKNIGTLATTAAAGTISATIPVSQAAGSGYRIRVTSSAPALTSADNGSNLTLSGCAKPTGLVASNITATGATFNWNTISCAIAYQLYRRVSGTTTWTKTDIPTNIGTANLTGLLPGTTYQFRLRAKCSASPAKYSAYTAIGTFTTLSSTTGAADLRGQNSLKSVGLRVSVLPNPASASATVLAENLSATGGSTLRLTDFFGKTVLEKTLPAGSAQTEIALDLVGLPAGAYLVVLENGSERATAKLLALGEK